jgi:peroxiredoxin Q/BCP
MLFGMIGRADEIALGAALPAVTVNDQDGRPVDLAAAGGQGWTLVYFYPKADTPGCTKQACSLRDAFASLTDRQVKVFGVSSDDVAAQKAFQQKYKLPFPLLADVDKKVMDAFGVPHKLGFASRQAFLFRDGELVWRDLSASTSEQAADVLAAIENPSASS